MRFAFYDLITELSMGVDMELIIFVLDGVSILF